MNNKYAYMMDRFDRSSVHMEGHTLDDNLFPDLVDASHCFSGGHNNNNGELSPSMHHPQLISFPLESQHQLSHHHHQHQHHLVHHHQRQLPPQHQILHQQHVPQYLHHHHHQQHHSEQNLHDPNNDLKIFSHEQQASLNKSPAAAATPFHSIQVRSKFPPRFETALNVSRANYIR